MREMGVPHISLSKRNECIIAFASVAPKCANPSLAGPTLGKGRDPISITKLRLLESGHLDRRAICIRATNMTNFHQSILANTAYIKVVQ